MGNPVVTTPSRTWLLILALQAQLSTITVANGYLTDIGTNIWTTDAQRPSDDALGLMIYSEPITGGGIDRERPGKPVRDFAMLLECIIGTDLDDAQQQIHSVIEDVENCMEAYAKAEFMRPTVNQVKPMAVVDVAILDRPEGAAVIACQIRVAARYFR